MNHATIILAMPKSNGMSELIEKNLQFHGFEVLRIDPILEFKYNNLLERICQFIHKFIFHDKSYKKRLKAKQSLEKAKKLLKHKQYDYTLVIRPDIYSQEVLSLLKQHTQKKFIGYQWDGLSRFPIKKLIPMFDKFFIFDQTDLSNPNYQNFQLESITNFYFDLIKPQPHRNKQPIAYFVGDHQACRVKAIEHCAKILAENGVAIKFIIPTSKRTDIRHYHSEFITFGKKNRLKYLENLANVNSADILVDFVIANHNGLSFRHFEALYFQKKLITTNSYVMNYDFYHPDNIFIWNDENLDGLKEFLAKPYYPINSNIINKYSLKSWIDRILTSK